MPRAPRQIRADVMPLQISDGEAARCWVRASEALLRAQARVDARLAAETEDTDRETPHDVDCAEGCQKKSS